MELIINNYKSTIPLKVELFDGSTLIKSESIINTVSKYKIDNYEKLNICISYDYKGKNKFIHYLIYFISCVFHSDGKDIFDVLYHYEYDLDNSEIEFVEVNINTRNEIVLKKGNMIAKFNQKIKGNDLFLFNVLAIIPVVIVLFITFFVIMNSSLETFIKNPILLIILGAIFFITVFDFRLFKMKK